MNRLYPLTLLATTCLAASACSIKIGNKGKVRPQSDPVFVEFSYSGPGTYISDKGEITFPGASTPTEIHGPELSPEERSKYCMVQVPQESDAGKRAAFLAALNGTWKRHTKKFSPEFYGAQFTFSVEKSYAELLRGSLGSKDDIDASRICVSEEIDHGVYEDYRIVELQAGNDGVAAFAVKFGSPAFNHGYPTLFMTEPVYQRHGARDRVYTPAYVFSSGVSWEQSRTIWVYPNKN